MPPCSPKFYRGFLLVLIPVTVTAANKLANILKPAETLVGMEIRSDVLMTVHLSIILAIN